MPIVGPNTSGKTSILDAITLCLGPVTELPPMRPDLVVSPASLVRRGSVHAQVACTVRFSDEEIEKTEDVFKRVHHPDAHRVPKANRVTVQWKYPDLKGQHRLGFCHYDPPGAHKLFKGRIVTARSFHVPGVSARDLQQLGGIFMFDQKRTGLAQRMTAEMRALASQGSEVLEESPGERAGNDYTHDPRLILLHVASRAQAPQDPEATEREDFARLRSLYANICKPHQIKGLYNTESGLDMEFEGQGIRVSGFVRAGCEETGPK